MDHVECVPAQDARLAEPHNKDRPAGFDPSRLDRAGWEKRASFLRDQALVAQGLWPKLPRPPIEPVIHGTIERDAYTIEKVYFASLPGHYVTGNLYRPRGRSGKLPVVLAPYGHWPDGRFVWKSDEDVQKELRNGSERDPNAARSPLQANCAMLARMGCIVFQYDMVGYCDSALIPHREGFLDAEAVLRLQSYMGLQTWNSIRSLDFVLTLPDVDPTRVAVTGSSSGGSQTIALTATDPRPSVAFPIVMVSMNMQGGCVCENAPLYRVLTNNVELASLFAPKPQGMAAANDWTKDFETRGLPEMKTIWRLLGAEAMVEGRHFNYGHNHNLHSREMQYSFLNRHLKLGWPEPVREMPFEPVHPSELSVYDEAHPLPADAVGAEGVRRWMTQAADETIAAMTPAEHASMVRTALKAMVVDEMPLPDEVEVRGTCLSRKGAGEHVPFEVIRPEKPGGDVVVWAHPSGRAGFREDEPAVRRLTDAGWTVVTVDVFGSGDFVAPPSPPQAAAAKPNPNPPYAGGYILGYQRSILANRVHDLLSAIALARGMPGTQRVHLLATGTQGPAGLLARALAGDAVQDAVIDLNQFDFDQVRDDSDPMLLPGGLKYGGIYAFVPLFNNGRSLITNARETGSIARARGVPGVTIEQAQRDVASLVEALLDAGSTGRQ